MAFAPTSLVLDPLGCLACGYIFFLFCFQSVFLEWPVVPMHIQLLLASALGSLSAPTIMHAADLWVSSHWRCHVRVFSVAVIVAGYHFMVHGPAPIELDDQSLGGKTFIITGCNTGIGYATASTLARAGATIVFACRSEDRACQAMKRLVEEADGHVDGKQLHFIPLDTSDFASVRKFAELLQQSGLKPHTLILNAGVMLSSRAMSADGYEMTMATNHLGHHLLVRLLLPGLLEAESRGEKPRIVIVGSNMCYMHGQFDFRELGKVNSDEAAKKEYLNKPYELFRAYGQSKLANLHFTTELTRRLQMRSSLIPVNQVHPGGVLTEVMHGMHPVVLRLFKVFKPLAHGFLKSDSQGSFCTLHVATDPQLATARRGNSGQHFIRLSPAHLSKAGSDMFAAKKLWAISDMATGEASMAGEEFRDC